MSMCGHRPNPKPAKFTDAYLDQFAYLDDDCSSKPCFSFGPNLDIPLDKQYEGNAAWAADFPTDSYSGRMGEGGYRGGGAGMMEALSCVGKVTQKASWWPWRNEKREYKCKHRPSNDYASRATPCSCSWYKFLYCSDDPCTF